MTEEKMAPDSTDVRAAIEYTRFVDGMGLDKALVRSALQTTMRIFDAWVDTLDLGDDA